MKKKTNFPMPRHFVTTLIALAITTIITAQSAQNIRGVVLDSESLVSLPGASIILKDSNPMLGASSDVNGHFQLSNVAVGRVSLLVKMIGYEEAHYDNLLLTSGKELYLEIKLTPSFEQLKEVVIQAEKTDHSPLNEMATLSARSFSVEETQRYAASAFDPARMASTFSGVAQGGDNLENLISVRGNSPKGILWRLEGIEIPNPNHFGDLGSSGGGISMMSSSTMSSSDFYTGAFPAEFGNATSGIFDINFRNGNSEVREHSIMFGALGLELASEGYFSSKSQASYLINYRYSTLSLLSLVYQPLGDVAPVYQDLSFKVNLPKTAIGALSFFGLAGDNHVELHAVTDSSSVDDYDELEYESYRSNQRMGVIGVKHIGRINNALYVKSTLAYSINRYTDKTYDHDPFDEKYKELFDVSDFVDDQASLHSSLNFKLDARNSLRIGLIGTWRHYNLLYDNRNLDNGIWTNLIDSDGQASQWEHYAQWKHRINARLNAHVGYHMACLPFNKTYSLEPRGALTYETSERSQLSLAVGLHSKPEHISTYYAENIDEGEMRGSFPNKDLEIPKSLHSVLGYKFQLLPKLTANAEAYFQYQYHLPVEAIAGSSFSIVNATDIWEILGSETLASTGKGRNYGVDLSLSRPFQDGLYVTANGSIYRSDYSTFDGDWFQTRFSRNYVLNLLGGKEFVLRKKNRILGVNAKMVMTGGSRETPINAEASFLASETIRYEDRAFTQQLPDYFRFDIGLSYKVNRERLTHTILLDVQNVSNTLNVFYQAYDPDAMKVRTFYQTGLFPFINYRVEFQGKRKKVVE